MIARTTRTLLEIVAASLLGVMLLAGAGAWRLTQGPIPLNFLTQHLVRALNSHDAPIKVTVERTILAWAGWDRALDIRVVGVKATGEDGKVIARVPEMSVSMSLTGLLRGIVAPRSLDLMGASVSLVRSRSGEFAMTLGAAGEESAAELIARIVHAVGAAPDPDRPITYLRRVSILGAGLTIDDRMTGAVWGAPRADLILLREAGEIRGAFFVELDIGGSSTRVNGAASWQPNSDVVRVETDVAGVRIDRIAVKVPRLKGLEGLRLGVNGRLDLTLSTNGALRSARFDLASGGGHLAYAALWPEGVTVRSARVQGRFDGDTESLDLERVAIGLDGTQLSGRVSAIRVGEGIAIDGRVEADRVSVADIGRYWPASVAQLARAWVVKNMPAGIAEQGRAGFSLRIADASAGGGGVSLVSLSGALRLRDTTIHYLEGMPPIRDVAGTAVFSRDRFIARVREAKSQGLSIRSGTVRLTKLDTDDEQADIEATIDGSLSDALALVDQPRLGFASRLGVRPRSVEGHATTRLSVSLPMRRDVQLSDSRIEATSQLRNVRVPDLVFGQTLSAQALALRVDRTRLEISGAARIADVPATVKWVERFDDGAHPVRQYEARAILDDAQRSALGLAALAPYLSGPVSVDLALAQPLAGPREMTLSLGLKDATLSLPVLRWRKMAGREGVASLALLLEQDGAVRVRNFDLRTPSLQARGAASFNRERELAEVRLEEFVQGRTNITGVLQTQPGSAWAIQIKGASLDVTPFLKQAENGEQAAPAWPPLLVRADVDRLWIADDAAIGTVMGKLVRDRSGWNEISVSGTVGQAKGVTLSYGREGAARRLRVHSNDAGELLRTFDVIETVQGGELLLSAMAKDVSDEAPWTGNLQITNFVLGEAPLMAQILTSASLTGIADMMSGRGIRFAKLDAPFEYRDGVVTVRNARTVGSELGITAEGEIDTEGDRLALTGTIVPAYTLNSLLGNIPILGNILTGKQGSGIFAATYRVDGPIRQPTVRVNPLAALAPGFLRNLIGIFDGTTKADKPPPPATDTN